MKRPSAPNGSSGFNSGRSVDASGREKLRMNIYSFHLQPASARRNASNQRASKMKQQQGKARQLRRIVILGAGFGGLACTRALRDGEAEITLVDQRNFHLFQPLLYQVATAALSPADIAMPVRRILRNQSNTKVILGQVIAIDR